MLPTDMQFFTKEGKPKHWAMHYTIAHWATLLKDVALGKYDLHCCSIDYKGTPIPYRKDGANAIQKATITVEG